MPYDRPIGRQAIDSVACARSVPFWLDTPARPAARIAPMPAHADLVVVGGGFSGLWCAIEAKLRDPAREVVLVEGHRIAEGASGRNGGFMAASLTHGLANGLERWPGEIDELLRLGHRNLDEIEERVAEWGIDCGFVRSGELDIAVTDHQAADLREAADAAQAVGEQVQYLDAQEVVQRVRTPLARAGLLDRRGVALVDPARLAWGLAERAAALGVVIVEESAVDSIRPAETAVSVSTRRGTVTADRVALCTNAYPPMLRRLRHYIVPVYDYALVTEPLSDAQWHAIGWGAREGLADAGNQFHYFRPTPDGRILWGGFDAVHHAQQPFSRSHEHDRAHHGGLAERFFEMFPQLAGLTFSHAWGGAIDTCARFAAFWGTALGGRVGYVAGYTGLGVGASRFGAQTLLDLLDGLDTERTRLEMVRTKPLPFPPEPLRGAGIALTTWSMARADSTGRRNAWLRALDAIGMGFDS